MIVSFNIPDAQVSRIADWIRDTMPALDENQNPITYTNAELLAEFKLRVKRWIRGEVQQYELLKEHEAIFAQYAQIDVTEV